MAQTLEVIGANEDGLVFKRAFVVEEEGRLAPRAIMGGEVCNIETRPGPLDDGLAFCQPMNVEAAMNWPLYVDVRRRDGDGLHQDRLWNMTRNQHIVAAARRFRELAAAGQVVVGQEL